MCIKDIIKVLRGSHRKFKQLFSNFTAGLLSGVIIGIFFSLMSKNIYEWIEFKNFGWIQFLIYLIFTIIFALLFYKFGKAIMPDGKEADFFYLNYVSGILSAIATSLFIIYSKNRLASFIISISIIIVFILISYSVLKKRKNLQMSD